MNSTIHDRISLIFHFITWLKLCKLVNVEKRSEIKLENEQKKKEHHRACVLRTFSRRSLTKIRSPIIYSM